MKQVNTHAPVVCSKEIQIHASAEHVWSILTNINEWASWQTSITKPRLLGDLKAGSEFVWKTGGVRIRSTIHTAEPFRYFGWTGKTVGLFAIHNWQLSVEGDVTTVRVEESMEGFLASLFKKSFNKDLEKGMIHWLQLLKKTCEK